MSVLHRFSVCTALVLALGISLPIRAQEATFFTGTPPSLFNVTTPNSAINNPDVHYYFSINHPESAIESLGQVSLYQQPNSDPITFNLPKTLIFQGTPDQRGNPISAQITTDPNNSQTILVTFDPPIPPGTTFTIGLLAAQNPSVEGVYQFRVQALPAGPAPVGLDLGLGRLQFYNNR